MHAEHPVETEQERKDGGEGETKKKGGKAPGPSKIGVTGILSNAEDEKRVT